MMLISFSLLTCALNKRQIKQGTLEFSFSISACKQAFLCKNFFAGRKRYKFVYYMLYAIWSYLCERFVTGLGS